MPSNATNDLADAIKNTIAIVDDAELAELARKLPDEVLAKSVRDGGALLAAVLVTTLGGQWVATSPTAKPTPPPRKKRKANGASSRPTEALRNESVGRPNRATPVLEAIEAAGADGIARRDLAAATGLRMPQLNSPLDRLSKAGKIESRRGEYGARWHALT